MAKKAVELKNEGGRYAAKLATLWGVFVFCLLLFIDLVTKIAADVYFNAEGSPPSIQVLPWGMMSLCIDYNPGIAFGSLGDASAPVKIGIVAGTAVIMLALTVAYFKMDARRTFMRGAFVFIVAGGVGNLIDRLYYQIWTPSEFGVRDMVQIDFSPLLEKLFGWKTNLLNFGICNFADFFIVGGAIALVLAFLFFDTDAFFPVGKYKALAKEAEEKETAKQAAKKAKKAQKAQKATKAE